MELDLSWLDATAPGTDALPGTGNIAVRVTLDSPALIGAAIVDQSFRETRDVIPGATVRGAVGFALRELLDNPGKNHPVQKLLAPDPEGANQPQCGAHFGFMYHTDSDASGDDQSISGPLPITATTCKRYPQEHGIIDTLLDRLVLLHASSADEAERAAAPNQCPQCQAPLRSAAGSRGANAPPAKKTITRVALDRTRQSAREGQLFTQILIERGAVFAGTIRNIPDAGRDWLGQALHSGILSFGRGRSAGWGRATIEVRSAPSLPTMAERAQAFDNALRARLQAAGLPVDRVGRLVPITLLAPLWPPDGDDGEQLLTTALPGATIFLRARRFAREGAWDQRKGQMRPFWATAAGGVFVVELAGATWRDVLDPLQELEQRGIGNRRDQGYGHILCFDPFFTTAARRAESPGGS